MDLGKIISIVTGLAGYKDREKSDVKSFIKDNVKFTLIVSSIVSFGFIVLTWISPDTSINLIMKLVIFIQS